jgi:phosphonate transport system substrate-binding protein
MLACNSPETSQIKIGIVPAQTHGNFDVAVEKLKTHLKTKLGREVNIQVFPNYSGVVEALNYQKLDLAYLGPLTYVIAHHKSGARAILTQLINDQPFYTSVLITQKDSQINSISDVVKKSNDISIAFGSISSTSGYLIPSNEFIKQNIYKDENNHNFKSIQFSGSHDVSALLVQNKKVEVAALDSAFLEKFIESKLIDSEKIKVIWTSDKLYQYPWTARSGLDEKSVNELQEAFVGIKDSKILSAFGDANAFIKTNDENYANIREIAKARGLINDLAKK